MAQQSIKDIYLAEAAVLERQARGLPTRRDVRSEEELRDLLLRHFGVRLPDRRCCHGHVSPWEFFCDAYFARHSVIVLKGSRGLAGKTWTLALLSLVEAVNLRANVVLLGGSGAQSARIHKAMETFWNHPLSPRHLLASDPLRMTTRFTTGNEIIALTASQRSISGPHPHRLRLDEVDEMDWRIFERSMGQTLSTSDGPKAQTVIASTHQNADGTFSKVLELAAEKGWPVVEWCWRETLKSDDNPNGWLPPSEVERKRSEMTADMWRTEVELQEPSSEGRAVDIDAVERMFRRDLGDTDGKSGKDEEFAAPVAGGTYAHGADWGKRRDYCGVASLRTDTRPMRFVAFYRDRKKPYHLMTPVLSRRLERFGGHGAHDAHGVGDVIRETLVVPGDSTLDDYTAWQGAQRIALFSEYIAAIERGEVEAPLSEPWYRAHRYVTNDDLYGAGHPPDEFVACALAYRASKGSAVPAKGPVKVSSLVWGR